MNIFETMLVLQSGLSAQRVRMNVTASNLANHETTRTEDGGPYQRRDPVFRSQPLGQGGSPHPFGRALHGVMVSDVVADTSPPRQVYEPHHPDANAKGFVQKPNFQMLEEMANMMTGSRAYEALTTAIRGVLDMTQKSLSLVG